jgi:hypothetical protein
MYELLARRKRHDDTVITPLLKRTAGMLTIFILVQFENILRTAQFVGMLINCCLIKFYLPSYHEPLSSN